MVPERFGGEVASIIGVAMGPVTAVELLFGEIRDGEHAGPGGGVGCGGEDHAVVKEDCFYWSHSCGLILWERETAGVVRQIITVRRGRDLAASRAIQPATFCLAAR